METMDINQPLDNINIVELCRACFETCGQYKLLFEDAEGIEKRSMGDVFSDVAKIEMKTNTESSPNRICLPCSKDLISAYKFIRKSQLNNNRLLEYLKNSSSIKQPDCLSEFPIDIPTDTNTADFLQIKVENEAISEYAEPLEDKISPPSSSDSAGSDYDDSPLHEEEKVNKLQCTYCNRIFKRMDFFQSHKRKHEEELKKRVNMDLNTDETGESSSAFLCDECGIGCATKFELKSHRLANHTTRVISSERESSDSSANQVNSVDKCGDGFFRLQRCPVAVTPQQTQTISTDNSDIIMLKLEINNLRETCLKEFSEIKALIIKQNEVKDRNYEYKRTVIRKDEEAPQNFTKIFPINSEEQLNTLNNVDDTQKLSAINNLKQLIYQGGLCQNMNRVFGNRIIVNYNYEGKRGKKSLKELANVNEILFKAAFRNGYTMIDYESDLRKGFKIMKNRYFKNECIKRKKIDVNPELKNMFTEMSG